MISASLDSLHSSAAVLQARSEACRLSTIGLLALVMLVFSLGGCQTLRGMMPSARKAEADRVAYQQLQTRNMRFADEYAGAMVDAAGDGAINPLSKRISIN